MLRYFTLLLILLPLLGTAQINRSANELAHETVSNYIKQKLFSNAPYNAGKYGELQPYGRKNGEMVWMISHDFEIMEPTFTTDKRLLQARQCHFMFYLDKKLKVVRADSAG